MKPPVNDWVPAFSTDKLYLAEIAVNLLSDEGIESYIINKTDTVLLVGDIEVFVKQNVVLTAKYVLKDLEV
jgi:hypothetical protein